MKLKTQSFFLHLAVFLLIEIIFVLILFREFPQTNLLTLIGVLHSSYWIILLFAGWLRERMHRIRQKALCTYLPILYHLFIHLYAGRAAIEIYGEKTGVHHDTQEISRMIIGALVLGILIFVGEYLLHRKLHCDTHHASAHAHCDDDCEETH